MSTKTTTTTTTTTTRTLFPSLPPELRSLIYSYLCAASSPSHNPHALFTKTYPHPHTTLTLCPTYTGSLSLLALIKYNVLEATEYNAYLLAHGVTVLVAIRFHGRVESFDKRCWAERTSAELRKLVERYDWLGKARGWDVRVLWDPKDYAARTRVGLRGRSGEVVRGMADTFGAFAREQEERVGRRKRGADVSVRWCLPSYVVPLHVGMEGCLGIERFLQPALGRRGVEGGVQTREAYVSVLAERYDSLDCERAKLGLFRMTRAVEKKGNLLVVANGKVAWRDDMAGGVLLMKTVEADGRIEWEAPDHDGEDAQQTPLGLSVLRNECLQARDHWLAGNREDGSL